jgi:hypothetical protein
LAENQIILVDARNMSRQDKKFLPILNFKVDNSETRKAGKMIKIFVTVEGEKEREITDLYSWGTKGIHNGVEEIRIAGKKCTFRAEHVRDDPTLTKHSRE